MTLTQSNLKTVVSYDHASGRFEWRPRLLQEFPNLRACNAWNARYAGKEAISLCNGYRALRIQGASYFAHRLAWLYVYGFWPVGVIDHINGDKLDNRISNLRDVSHQANSQNIKSSKRALPLGVYFQPRKKERRYSAKICTDGKQEHLGYFDTPEDAHTAYLLAKRVRHVGCTI